jgi:UDP-glucose 4-epimerase
MNILMTGGAGYIGCHTAVVLCQLGHNVVLLDNLSNSSERVLDKLFQITGKRLPLIKGDTRNTALVTESLRSHYIEAVFHFAGLKAVGESVAKPLSYYSNNVQGTLSLLEAMRGSAIKTLVFSSSATVYGQPQYLPLDENHPTSATNPYGRSKLQIEEILNDVAISDPEWRIACLRYFNPVGAHDSGMIGENPNGVPDNLMPYIAQVAAGQRNELSVFGDDYPTPDGTGVRDYIHVMDLAEGHVAAMDLLSRTAGWHAINLGTGKGYSVLEMVHAFENASGRKVPYRVAPRRAGDVAECYAKPDKASDVLHWTAKRSLDDMCTSTWDFQKSVELNSH